MATYSIATVKKLFGKAGNRCAFPDCSEQIIRDDGHIAGEICHIRARSSGGPRFDPKQNEKERNAYENLILLCRNHHQIIDAQPGPYSVSILTQMKKAAESVYGRPSRLTDEIYAKLLIAQSRPISFAAHNSNIAVNSSNVIQTSVFNFRNSSKPINVIAPLDAIGSNIDAIRYIEHLIKRYNEFAKLEQDRTRKFNYAVIRKNIEHKFRSNYKLLHISRAEEVFHFIQGRILKTRIARFNQSKGIKSFSSFDEFTRENHRDNDHLR